MNKETVIANLRADLSLSERFQTFLAEYADFPDAWFAREGGDLFLSEFRFEWETEFVQTAQAFYAEYFAALGVPQNQLPQVKLTDSHRGSWIMEAALTMFGTVGTVYTILKGVSELPKIADNLEETKKRFQKDLADRFADKVTE